MERGLLRRYFLTPLVTVQARSMEYRTLRIAILCVGYIVYKGLLTTYVDWVDILSKFQPLRPTSHQNKHAIELFSLAHIEMKTKSKLPPNNMEAIPWTGEKQCRAKKRPPDIPEMFSPGKNIRFNFRPLARGANYCSPHFVQRTLWREKLPNVTFLTINQAGETN